MNTPNVMLVVLAAIATYRAARFLTGDKVGEPIRTWAGVEDDDGAQRHPWLAYLVTCDWCVSTYLGVIGAVIIVNVSRLDEPWTVDVVWGVALWLTLSGVTGLLSTVEQTLDARAERDKAEAAAIEATSGP